MVRERIRKKAERPDCSSAQTTALTYSLIDVARLYRVDPVVQVADLLVRFADPRQSRFYELLPWDRPITVGIDDRRAAIIDHFMGPSAFGSQVDDSGL